MDLRMLRQHQIRRVRSVGQELGECVSLSALSDYACHQLVRHIPSETAIWNEFRYDGQILSARVYPDVDQHSLASGVETFRAHAHQHPCFRYLATYRPKQSLQSVSDHMSLADFRETGLFREHYSKIAGLDQITFYARLSDQCGFGFSLQRGRAFSDSDKCTSSALLPYMINAYSILKRNEAVEARIAFGIRATQSEHAWALLTRSLGPFSISLNCDSFLREHLGVGLDAMQLPIQIQHKIRHAISEWGPTLDGTSAPFSTFQVVGPSGTVECGVSPLSYSDSYRIAFLPKTGAALPSVAPSSLSRREKEILHWLLQGKTNYEIGRICGISHRTVEKHVERVASQLGVRRRVDLMRAVKLGPT